MNVYLRTSNKLSQKGKIWSDRNVCGKDKYIILKKIAGTYENVFEIVYYDKRISDYKREHYYSKLSGKIPDDKGVKEQNKNDKKWAEKNNTLTVKCNKSDVPLWEDVFQKKFDTNHIKGKIDLVSRFFTW